MGFIIRIPGQPEIDSSDFTIDEIDAIEREADVYWIMAHPWRQVKVARAFMRVAYARHGMDPKLADDLRLRNLTKVFDYVPDEEETEAEAEEEVPTKARKGRSRVGSSDTSQSATSGLPPLAANSA